MHRVNAKLILSDVAKHMAANHITNEYGFCHQIGVANTLLTALRKGQRAMYDNTLIKLAAALGKTPAEYITRGKIFRRHSPNGAHEIVEVIEQEEGLDWMGLTLDFMMKVRSLPPAEQARAQRLIEFLLKG
jgi:hypothetical protein